MTRRVLIAVVALALVVPAVASASPGSQSGNDRVPSAQLQATGGGAMTVTGRMAVNGSIMDRGSIVYSCDKANMDEAALKRALAI